MIDGRSVIAELDWDHDYDGQRVVVQIGEETVEGTLDVLVGSEGYSDWTPGMNAMFYVGREDLLERLLALEGQRVVLTVARAA